MTATLDTTTTAPAAGVIRRHGVGPRLGAIALVVGAGGNTAEAVLSQVVGDRPETIGGQVALAQEHPTLITTMIVVGLVAVPFMAVGFVAAAQELALRARRTAAAAGSLLVVGMWGLLGIQVVGLVQILALLAEDGRPAAQFIQDLESHPVANAVFGLPFFAGCVLGMLTLTIALLVKGGMSRWIPGAWLAFIVVDFSIGRIGPVDPHWLYLAGAVGLATHLLRRRLRAGG